MNSFFETNITSEKEEEATYADYLEMENLFEKLKLLNYYSEFVNSLKMKPINSHYFMITKNSGEHFFLFASLSSWLIRKLGKPFDEPQEYDDPNDTIANILQIVREHGVVVDFPPNKLKQGIGKHVIFVLNKLCDEALKYNKIEWKRPQITEEKETEEEEEEDVIEDDSEIILDQVEEEMLAAYSDDSDEDILKIEEFNSKMKFNSHGTDVNFGNMDLESWKIELERVLPQLKLTIKSSSHDWRSRLENMKNNHLQIKQSLSSAKMQLTKVQKDISFSLEKIQNREKYLNKELESTLKEYIIILNQLSKIKEEYNSIGSNVTEKTRQLTQLNDTLETYKQQMEARGNSMTDGTPVVNIKKSISKLKSEIVEMDVRIGVLECFLIQDKLREKRTMEDDVNSVIKVY